MASNLLTTVFTTPADCFQSASNIQQWAFCQNDGGSPTFSVSGFPSVSCWWSQPRSCYPPGGVKANGQNVYSPGVMPSGMKVFGNVTDGGTTSAYGCLEGWEQAFPNCKSTTSASYFDVRASTTTTGNFYAIVQQIAVVWASEDLSLFTPASAPILPAASLAKYEASAAARSQAGIVTSTSLSMTGSTGSLNASAGGWSDQNRDLRLSPTAKLGVGIGIGVGVSALICLVFGFILIRRKKYGRPNGNGRPHRSESKRAYIDSKAELEDSRPRPAHSEELPDREPGELAASERPQELAAYRETRGVSPNLELPPVPFSSKSRFLRTHEDGTMHELA